MIRVCMLTQSQPAINPRLVKEADALVEAGFQVEVLCSQNVEWASAADQELVKNRKWSCVAVGAAGRHDTWPRLRHKVARTFAASFRPEWFASAAAGRNVAELTQAACARPADLFIARHPGALHAAATAAQQHGGRLGYDAEDFESGHSAFTGSALSRSDSIAESLERRYLPCCNYVTAGSPAIADAYAEKYGIERPTPVLNVFPLSDRPSHWRTAKPNSPLKLYWFSQTIGPDRGLQDVVRAVGLLPACNIELHLRGQWTKTFEAELRALAASVGVLQHRIVQHPPGPPDEMVRLAAEYDVGLALEQPVSRNRMICLTNKLFTYMLAGNAIAATLTPGQEPVLRAIGEAACSYRHGDIQSLAAALRIWHDDRAALEGSRGASWRWGADRYNWDIEKETFLSIVEKTVRSQSVELKTKATALA